MGLNLAGFDSVMQEGKVSMMASWSAPKKNGIEIRVFPSILYARWMVDCMRPFVHMLKVSPTLTTK